MTITVNTPDGGTAQFPDDTPKDAIVSAMKAKFGGPDESSSGGMLDTAANVAKSFSDTVTFGTGDYLRSLMTGEDIGKLQASSKKAHEDLGLGDIPVTIAGYAANPFGMAGVGERIGANLVARGAPKLLGYGAGAAAEGAAAQTLGDIGHGEAPGSDVVTAGALSAPFGAAVGGRGRALGSAIERATGKKTVGEAIEDFRGPETPPPRSVSEAVLKTNSDAAYSRLEATPIKTGSVGNAIERAMDSLTPGERAGLSGRLRGRINDVNSEINAAGRNMTLGDVHSFASTIGKGMQDYAPSDSKAAARIAENLNNLDPRGLMADARAKFGQFKDAQMLNQGLKDSAWYRGANAADTIATAAEKTGPDAVTNFSPAGREAMAALGNAGPSTFGKMADAVIAKGGNRLIAGGLGALGGGALGHEAIGALIGASGVGPGGLGGYMARMRTNAKARRAMKAALAATSTGLPATADMFRGAPWASQAARQAIYARGAADT